MLSALLGVAGDARGDDWMGLVATPAPSLEHWASEPTPPVPSVIDTDPDGGGQPEVGPDPAAGEAEAAVGPEATPEPSILRDIFTGWDGELRFGLELASGNNDRTRFRGGFDINKKYDGHSTRLRSEYVIARNNAGESENRLTSSAIQDWGTGGTKFSGVFLRADGDLDRFQDFDYRLNVSTGARYTALKNDKTELVARIGGSVRREFGGPDDDYVPEGAFFVNFKHKIGDRQRVGASLDYLPELEQVSRYRLIARANWDVDIDPESGLGLRLKAENRYDARPNRRPERNDFDLSVLLFWRF
ncbi:MAG: DUF481 domain-containing protein [Planctomycetota bacterium]